MRARLITALAGASCLVCCVLSRYDATETQVGDWQDGGVLDAVSHGEAQAGRAGAAGHDGKGGAGVEAGGASGSNGGAAGTGGSGGSSAGAAGSEAGAAGGAGSMAGAAGSEAGGGGGPICELPARQVQVTNDNSESLAAGFQVLLRTDAGRSGTSWAIARSDGSGCYDIAVFVDHFQAGDGVWFNAQQEIAPSDSDSNYWLYERSPAVEGDRSVFDFYDDSFPDWEWTRDLGITDEPSGGILIDGSGGGSSIYSTRVWSIGYALDFGMIVAQAAQFNGPEWFGGGFQPDANTSPWDIWISHAFTSSVIAPEVNGDTGGLLPTPLDLNQLHIYTLERGGVDNTLFRYDLDDPNNPVRIVYYPSWNFPSDSPIRFSAYSRSQIEITFARVRRARSSVPSVWLLN
jgi:hypothetical protein